jgi:hypothetical protein
MESVGSGQIAQQFGSQRGWDDETQLQVQRFLIGHRDETSLELYPPFFCLNVRGRLQEYVNVPRILTHP